MWGKENPIEMRVAQMLKRVKRGAGAEKALAALVALADLDVEAGTCEEPKGSNRGGMLLKFFAADDYAPNAEDSGYPWCASAVSYWVQTWLKGCPEAKSLFGKVQAPRTAGAFALQTWAEKQRGAMEIILGALFRAQAVEVRPGDIVVMTFSHVGIAKTRSHNGLFTCIEGNTDAQGSREGWQVARRVRGASVIRAVLRFVPKGVPV